ncbi:MAG: pilus assembly protein PilP [Nitrospinota bacterium]
MIVRILLVIVLLLGAAYAGFIYYGGTLIEYFLVDQMEHVSTSVQSFHRAVDQGNQSEINKYIASSFKDSKIKRQDLLKKLLEKRDKYQIQLLDISIEGDLAMINYKRRIEVEKLGVIKSLLQQEQWVRHPASEELWQLVALSPRDKYLRGLEVVYEQVATKDVDAGDDELPDDVDDDQEAELGVSSLEERQKEAEDLLAMKPGVKYNPAGKRDPFQALIEAGPAGPQAKVCEPDRPRGLLESFDLALLKLTGVLDSRLGYLALIETPDGKGFTVRRGMYLGKNCGLVQEVESDSMLIRELVKKPGPDPDAFLDVTRKLELRP